MIAFAKPRCEKSPAPDWRNQFLGMMPQIQRQARIAFRSACPELQEDLITEVLANAFVTFARLVERGKADLAYATPLAQFAIRQIRAGRRVGKKLNVRDVSSTYSQRAKGIAMERLDRFDVHDGQWREALIEDRKAGPAETAAARIDMAAWFRSLARATRSVARALARGESTSTAARLFHLSPGRISQLRRELECSWEVFQGGRCEKV